jgi:hypothetical protein
MSKSIPIFGGGYRADWRARDDIRLGRAFMQDGMLHYRQLFSKPETNEQDRDDNFKPVVITRKVGGGRLTYTQYIRGKM